jgi:hypothetical protein
MRVALALAVVGAVGLSASAASAQVTRGNDTGGIIPWSCENEAWAPQIAAAHCARWDKYPRITGVHRQYGDFISFNCLWTPHDSHWILPPVHTRSRACARVRYRGMPVKALD